MGVKVKSYLNLKSVLMSFDVDNCFIYFNCITFRKILKPSNNIHLESTVNQPN